MSKQFPRSARRSVLALPAIAAVLIVSACSAPVGATSSASGNGLLQRAEASHQLKVAIGNEAPQAYMKADGTITGVEVEILRHVVKELGITDLQGEITPFESMIPGLQAKRWDVIAAGLNMKQSRCESALFSEPTIVSTESFAVKKGNPKNLTSLKSIVDDPGVTVGTLPGSFEETSLEHAGVPKSQISLLQDIRSGFDALQAGRIDAYFSPTSGLKEIAKDTPAVEVTAPLPDALKAGSGVVFRKEDVAFRDEFNKRLAEYKATPAYGELLKKWGYNAADVKGVTTEQLCKNPG